MTLLDALFKGAKAILKEAVDIGRGVLREILKEIDNSHIGRVTTKLVEGLIDRHFKHAADLAREEQELAEKARRDGRRSEHDAERLREIEEERRKLRRAMEEANASRAAQEFKERADSTNAIRLDDDELSSNVGILSAKDCPTCGGKMRIRQGYLNGSTGLRNFYWQCTEPNRISCPTITLTPEKMDSHILRTPDADLDTPRQVRREVWARPEIISRTHGRVRQHLDEDDKEVVCPTHLLPMKLLPKRRAGGLLLDSYEYVCLGVNADGRACDHVVEMRTMPQVASMLKRQEGTGIIQ
jgi:hypothetical protein